MIDFAGQNRLADTAERFRQTVLPHLGGGLTLARYLLPNKDSAEDVVQEAAVRALQAFDSCHGENVKAWFLAIVRNCCFTWMGREKVPGRFQGLDDLTGDPPAELVCTETPEDLLIRNDNVRAIRAAITKVPLAFREVLILKDIEDLSYREIAQVTEVPLGTVMSRLSRARKMFQDIYTAGDLPCAFKKDVVK